MAQKKKSDPSAAAGGHTLVIVESPTKAKTIRKFLGKSYTVESCMGHIRDLPQSAKDIPEKFKKEKWAQLGVNPDEGFDPIYCVPKSKTKVVSLLKEKLKSSDRLLLATDEDREGESISWHLLETLKPKVPYRRMVFNEITQTAIEQALTETRDINFNLVRAQEARRILDRLVGYTISPLLWKKVAYGLSAGRVQSVAVKLIVQKELERLKFQKSVYWGIEASHSKQSIEFQSRLVAVDGSRIATGRDFDPDTGGLLSDRKGFKSLSAKEAQAIVGDLKNQKWVVTEVETKPISRKPPAPFITSTLQQEANRKLGLSARETMQVAQSLYEQGFITYMRTDSTFLSAQALDAARARIKKLYGADYLPDSPRTYEGKKAKGAQEAHEAIRPSGAQMLTLEETGLSGMPGRLYELIWKRTMASQMVNSRQMQVAVQFAAGNCVFAANGMTIEFPGFLRAYVEGQDDETKALEEREVRLPALTVKEEIGCSELIPQEHETKPPARYTDASLVSRMEKEGIGRPSTYASIIGTIIDRGYVRKAGNALVPTFTAMVVGKLLEKHLPEYVDLQFTSSMEGALDEIAEGDLDATDYLKSVYFGEKKGTGLKALVESREKVIDPSEARSVSLPGLKGFDVRVGRFGAYVCRASKEGEQCASLPDAQAPADLSADAANKLIDQKLAGTDALGKDPKTGRAVYVLNGRYGPYVQLGEVDDEEDKPKRVSLPQGLQAEDVTLAKALQLLELPKTLGQHPGTGKDVKAGLGRFGPYIVHDGDFRSIPKAESLFEIQLNRALELLSQPKAGRGRAAPIREIGPIPKGQPFEGQSIALYSGKYGPYVKLGTTNASLSEGMKPEDVTVEQALDLLVARGLSPTGPQSKKAKSSKAVAGAKKAATRAKASSKSVRAELVAQSGRKKPSSKSQVVKRT